MKNIQKIFNEWKKIVIIKKEHIIGDYKILNIIHNNEYIKNITSNKNRNKHSLCYLLSNKNLSQSDNIKFGIIVSIKKGVKFLKKIRNFDILYTRKKKASFIYYRIRNL